MHSAWTGGLIGALLEEYSIFRALNLCQALRQLPPTTVSLLRDSPTTRWGPAGIIPQPRRLRVCDNAASVLLALLTSPAVSWAREDQTPSQSPWQRRCSDERRLPKLSEASEPESEPSSTTLYSCLSVLSGNKNHVGGLVKHAHR